MAPERDAKERMIRAATELFHRHGIQGTSVDEILKRSRTGKSQFAHYFRSKDGLIHAVIENLHSIIRNGQAPTGYELRSWEDFFAWFGKYIDFQKGVRCELSCPLGTIGSNLSEEQELLRQDIKLFFEWCTGKLVRFFAERKAAGELNNEADPDALADLCMAVMEGGMLMTKITRDTRCFENAAEQVIRYVRGLSRPLQGVR